MGRRFFWVVCALGLGVRLVGLDAWGTFDVEVQKAWALRAAENLGDIYGPSDRQIVAEAARAGGVWPLVTGEKRFPRTEFTWGTARYFVDYPPGSLVVLALEGRIYRALRPDAPNKPLLNALVNLGPLLASLVLAGLLYRTASSPSSGASRAASFWLNPAVIFAAPFLGYPDPIFSVLAVASILVLARGRLSLAAGLGAAAALIKPQGVLLAPVIFGVLARRREAKEWAKAVFAGILATVAILAPWWTQGYVLSALDGVRRPFSQGTLSALGLNVWWVAGWIADNTAGEGSGLARIWTIDAFTAAAGFDPTIMARLALAMALLFVFLWTWRRRVESEGGLALAAIVMVHTYALLSTSVHENHTFLAVALAPLLLYGVPWARTVLVATSIFLALSLFFAAGLGRRVTRLRTIEDLRFQTGLDPTVVVAVLHVALVAFLWWLFARVTRKPREDPLTP
jgi:Gpi18-like mannosyltransferase